MQQYPIGTALLSFGLSGQVFHAPFVARHPSFRLLGAWERSQARIAAAYPGTRRYESLEDLLADPAVALVVVNTPIPTHFDYARRALRAGKHVVVEKAFTTTAAEAQELAALARERGCALAVYQNRRWDSDFLTVRQLLDAGRLGDVIEAELRFDRFRPAPGPKAHVEEPGPGAGTLYDLGPHLLDQALALFGWPESVFARLHYDRPGTRVPDGFELLLSYPATAAAPARRVRLHAGQQTAPVVPAYQFFGRRGAFLKHRADPQEAWLRGGHPLPPQPDWGREEPTTYGLLYPIDEAGAVGTAELVPSLPGDYGHFYAELHRSLTTGRPVPVPADPDGVRVMQLIEAAIASDAAGAVVKV